MKIVREHQKVTKNPPDMTLSALDQLRVKGTTLYNSAYPG